MRNNLLIIPFLLLSIAALAQTSLKVDPDSVKFINTEFVLRNNTKDIDGYLYNTGNGKTVFRKLGKGIQFRVGASGFPVAGDSIYQNAALSNYFLKVLRNGLLQYRDTAQGIKVDESTGKITFYPALQANDLIYIEALTGIDFSLNGAAANATTISTDTLKLNAGIFDNGNKTFTLRWLTNAKSLYIGPRIVGIGSSTLAGYGLSAPDRLGDKILAWLTNNTYGAVWENLSVAGYSSIDVLPVANGGVLGHNIESALSSNPDFIFVSLPTNDPSAGITVNQSIANLKKLDSMAIAKGVPVFIETTQPRTTYNSSQQLMLRQLADSIRAIWPNRYIEGFKDVVDPSTTAAILPLYNNGDGVHLTSAGNQFIANSLFDRWLDFFQPVKTVKRYVVDSSLDKISWSQFKVETEPNNVKNNYARFNDNKQYFRVRAELKDGTYTPYSNIATLDQVNSPTLPGVNDYTYRLLIDLGGDGVTTQNGSDVPDGKPTPSPDNAGKYWNNWYGVGGVAGFADKSAFNALRTTTNEATAMSVQIIGLPQGTFNPSAVTKSINYNGFNVAVGDYPSQAVYDNMFIYSSNNPDGIVMRIKGLAKNNTYYIKLWGARLDDGTAPRTLQAKLGSETWTTAQSVDTKYPTTGTGDYSRAVTFNYVSGLDSVDINLRTGGTSTFAHVSVVDIGVVGPLPLIPQIKLRDTSTTASTITLVANPINGASIASFTWSQISGPNTSTIATTTSATASISGLTNGTFIYRVTGTDTSGKVLSTDATVKVYPNNGGKKTLRIHFSKTAVASIPGWFNVYGQVAGTHIIATDTVTNWTIDNVSDATTYWAPYAGNSSSNTDGSTTGNNSGIVPDIVLQGLWYNYSLKYAAGMDNLLIKGLNPAKTYTIKFYASRNTSASAPRYGAWRVNGTSEILQNALGNTTNESVVSTVSPDATGVIKLSVHAPASATYGSFSYINGLVIQEN
jgi:lysophospholipase L1-like esterase